MLRRCALLLVFLAWIPAVPAVAGTRVVASVYPLAMIASAVAREDTEVKHLVPTAVPLASWRPSPDDLQLLASAQVIVWSGPESEPGLADAIARAAPSQRVITLSKLPGVIVRERRVGPADTQTWGRDPNLWLSTRNAAILGVALGAYLGNPLAAEHFDAEMQRFRARQAKRFEPVAKIPLYASQDAWGYLLDELGLANVTAVVPGPRYVPSERRLADVAAHAAQDRVACMIGEPGFETGIGPQVFPDGRASLVVVDPQLAGLTLSRTSYTLSLTYLAETIYNCLVTR